MKTSNNPLQSEFLLMEDNSSEHSPQSVCDARRATRLGKRTRVAIASPEAPAPDLFSGDLPPLTELPPSAGNPAPRKVLVIDVIPINTTGVKAILNAEPDLIAWSCSPSDAISAIENGKWDAIAADLSKPIHFGLIKSILNRWPSIPIAVYSSYNDDTFPERAIRAGAKGYVKKENSQYEFPNVVREIIRGNFALPVALKDKLLREALGLTRGQQTPIEALSDCELVVLYYIGKAYGTRRLAEELGVSVKTVESHRAHLKEKLQLATAPDLLLKGFQWMSTLA